MASEVELDQETLNMIAEAMTTYAREVIRWTDCPDLELVPAVSQNKMYLVSATVRAVTYSRVISEKSIREMGEGKFDPAWVLRDIWNTVKRRRALNPEQGFMSHSGSGSISFDEPVRGLPAIYMDVDAPADRLYMMTPDQFRAYQSLGYSPPSGGEGPQHLTGGEPLRTDSHDNGTVYNNWLVREEARRLERQRQAALAAERQLQEAIDRQARLDMEEMKRLEREVKVKEPGQRRKVRVA